MPGPTSDDDLRVNPQLTIPAAELEWSFTASGGPGGQHANTSNTRAEVRFVVTTSEVLDEAQRSLIIERLGPVVRVAADDERSQLRNRALAAARLATKLSEALKIPRKRRASRPSPGATARRLEEKARTSQRKADRQQSRRPSSDD